MTGPVESITPVVSLTSPHEGTHVYAIQIIGPKPAGETPFVEMGFAGHRTLVQAETRAIAFNRLTKHGISTAAIFPPGTYKLRLVAVSGKAARTGNKLVLSESMKLVARAGC